MNRSTLSWSLRLCALLGLGLLYGPASGEPAGDDGFRIVERAPITIPIRALNDGVTSGVVQLTLLIDAEGKLSDTLVTAYTNRHLAEAAREAVGSWQFSPSRIGGKLVPTVLELQFLFQSDGLVVWDRPAGAGPRRPALQLRPLIPP